MDGITVLLMHITITILGVQSIEIIIPLELETAVTAEVCMPEEIML